MTDGRYSTRKGPGATLGLVFWRNSEANERERGGEGREETKQKSQWE